MLLVTRLSCGESSNHPIVVETLSVLAPNKCILIVIYTAHSFHQYFFVFHTSYCWLLIVMLAMSNNHAVLV